MSEEEGDRLQPGDRIGRWEVEVWLGSGAKGAVYRCHAVDRPELRAAVKVVAAGLDELDRARFLREAAILRELDHASVCAFLDVGDTPPHLAMEFVEGETLSAYIARYERVPLPRALELVRQITEALSYVHARGVWHRDIKPDNVLINERGWVKLVDFGISVRKGTARLTAEGLVAGTIAYMPPEAMDVDDPDPAVWDLYGVGVLLHQMITGTQPFEPRGEDGRVDWRLGWYQKVELPCLDPGEGTPDPVRELVRDLTARLPTKRVQTAAELGRRLQALQSRATRDLPFVDAPSSAPGRSASEATTQKGAMPRPPPESTTVDLPAEPAPVPSPSAPEPRSGLAVVAGALGGAGITMLALTSVALVLVALMIVDRATRGQGARVPVRVVVEGPTRGTLYGRIGDERVSAPAGEALSFAAVLPGEQQVWLAVGKDCDRFTCPGEACDACCTWMAPRLMLGGAEPVTVAMGQPPSRPERRVRLLLGGARATAAWLDGHVVPVSKDSAAGRAPIGRTTWRVDAGSCTEDQAGCAGSDTCPAGCRSWTGELEVPCGATELTVPVKLEF